ncbi:transmembrane family 220 helix protein [Nitzschia inconspicua]|uniref:Transmembrane family 220 helix protein n=1 Tax=Nitzschia inconspicua TaxID=303405 RepID=A0A9K3PJC7_9STRA|nr:transmembrane family 220 helix protein [Nitzschia inconspicua]
MADTPDWLKPTDNDLALAGSASTDVEEGGSTPMSQEMTPNKKTSNTSADDSTKKCFNFSCSCGAVAILLVSCAFLAVFVFSAIVQKNDLSDHMQWLLFYSLSAAVVALFMISYMCCFPTKAFYVLSVGMSIWAIVIIIMTALEFSKSEKGGPKEGTGDNDSQTLRQELGYELGGASLSLISSLYHTMILCCCVNKEKKEE